jgi:hypothetical protein
LIDWSSLTRYLKEALGLIGQNLEFPRQRVSYFGEDSWIGIKIALIHLKYAWGKADRFVG